MEDKKKRAKVLLEALPYIQKYSGKTIVIKYGGNAMTSEVLKNSVMKDIVMLQAVGINVVLVHGGGPDISEMLSKLGMESIFVDGLRYTDESTAEIVAMVLAGKVNKSLVAHIHKTHGKAIGLSGIDGSMLLAKKKENIDLGFVGDIISVNPEPIMSALERGYIPVIATVGVGNDGELYNINADTAAAEIAAAVGAEKLFLLTDVRGVLRDREDNKSLMTKISRVQIDELVRDGIIQGGMIPKIEACITAMKHGLREAVVLDGRIEHSIMLELFSNSGIGTLIYK